MARVIKRSERSLVNLSLLSVSRPGDFPLSRLDIGHREGIRAQVVWRPPGHSQPLVRQTCGPSSESPGLMVRSISQGAAPPVEAESEAEEQLAPWVRAPVEWFAE